MARKVNAYPIPTICNYCGAEVIYTSNAEIYGREYGNGKCYKCTNNECDSYVGVHTSTQIPLGRLANKELRELKKQCHTLFDPVWNKSITIRRDMAYKRLASLLGIPSSECHFGWFDKEMLLKSLEIMRDSDWYKEVSSVRAT